MHSSRMHTARSLTASCSIHGVAGGELCVPEGACMAEGHVCLGGMHGRGACVPGGMHGSMAGGHACLGACVAGGPCVAPVNRMTDTCENITLPPTSFAGGQYGIG